MRDESRQAGGEMVSPAAPKAPLGGGLSSSLIPHPSSLSSAWRAWLYLVVLSWQRQARARYMLWIALGLMAFSALFTGVQTARGRWGMGQWREPWRGSRLTYAQWEAGLETSSTALPWPAGQRFLQAALAGAARVTIRDSGVYVFSLALFGFFLTFLLPIWSLSFAT